VALLLMAAYAWSGFSDRRSVERELALVRADLDSVRRDLIAKQSTLAAFLGPEVHSVSLTAADGSKPAVRVFWNHTRNVFIVTAFDLPPAPAGRTYQLWAIAKDRPPRSMGTFDTDAEAGATIVFPVTDAIGPDDYIDSCGLTIEPAGGSGQPSEAPRLMGDWRHTD